MTRPQLMVVEDEVVTAMALDVSLRRLGYDVAATASTGEEAVAKAREMHLDAILMDIRLKGEMDGIAAAEAIRRHDDVPVIYLTAFSDAETLKRAKVAEPHGYIVKPFTDKELRAAIEVAMHNSAMERDRKAAAGAIQTREKLLQDVLDQSLAAIYLKDTEARYTLVNRQFEAIFAKQRGDLRGKEDHEILDPAVRTILGPDDRRVLQERRPRQDVVTIPMADGPHTFVAVRSPIESHGGRFAGMCGILTDITKTQRRDPPRAASAEKDTPLQPE